jgi:23S rRNA pseudouridine2605 synthase
MEERLQKIISRAGIASRRKAEELIRQGRVTVNGQALPLGSKADLERDHIKVDGKLLRSTLPEPIYLMLNKPKGCVTTMSDPQGRPTVRDFLGRYQSRVFPVGRLDFQSEGLLLFTNDGDFAASILSAKTQVPKTYRVKANGTLSQEAMQKFRDGIPLDGRPTAPARIRLVQLGDNPWYEVTLTEGRKNQIRRMFKSLGFLVEKLKRIRVGPLSLGDLGAGEIRPLTAEELRRLQRAWRNKVAVKAPQANEGAHSTRLGRGQTR